jgi:hypothetical protein
MNARGFLPHACAAAAVFGALLSNNHRLRAEESGNPTTQVVEVSGAGTDIEGAKKDACREAVRQVVGAYVASQTRTENDELIEDRVISLSSGFVEKIETLKESQADGLTRVRIRATVRISKVLESLKANQISVTDVDGGSLGAELLTKGDQRKGAADLVAAAFEGFPAKWFQASVEGKPRLGERIDGTKIPVIVTVVIEPDLEAFTASATKLEEAFKALDRPRGDFQVDHTKCECSRLTPEESAKALRYDIISEGRFDLVSAATPITCIDGDLAFPRELVYFSNAGASVPVIMPNGFLPLMFPVKFFAGGRRSAWKWHAVPCDDAVTYFALRLNAKVRCDTALIDQAGQEVAIDTWELFGLGIGGAKLTQRQINHTVAVAPAVIQRQGVNRMFSKFSCERTFLLEEDEVRALAKVSVSLK